MSVRCAFLSSFFPFISLLPSSKYSRCDTMYSSLRLSMTSRSVIFRPFSDSAGITRYNSGSNAPLPNTFLKAAQTLVKGFHFPVFHLVLAHLECLAKRDVLFLRIGNACELPRCRSQVLNEQMTIIPGQIVKNTGINFDILYFR